MDDLLTAVLIGWMSWSAWNLLLVVASCYVEVDDPSRLAYVQGIWVSHIRLRPDLPGLISKDEYVALYLHEQGHVELGHLRWNAMVMVLLPFWPRSARSALKQEYAADTYVFRMGYGAALASALRKLSLHPTDHRRADLLERACRLQVSLARGTRAHDEEH